MSNLTHHAERLISEEMEMNPLETRCFLGMVKAGRPVQEAVKALHPDCANEILVLTAMAVDEGINGDTLRAVIINPPHHCV